MSRFLSAPTAAFLVIGNEILSGRTREANIHTLANALVQQGIRLKEVRVVPDEEAAIVQAVQSLAAQYDHLFTSGGIGPTHDDITVDAIAAALGLEVTLHPEAEQLLRNHYGTEVTDARLRMARTPVGASLIPNRATVAPGMQIRNIYIMAGVPSIFTAMVEAVVPHLPKGAVILSRSLSARIPESKLADGLRQLQQRYPDVDIGSYPQMDAGQFSTSIVLRSTHAALLQEATDQVCRFMQGFGQTVTEETA